jgi:hypothetical protein
MPNDDLHIRLTRCADNSILVRLHDSESRLQGTAGPNVHDGFDDLIGRDRDDLTLPLPWGDNQVSWLVDQLQGVHSGPADGGEH